MADLTAESPLRSSFSDDDDSVNSVQLEDSVFVCALDTKILTYQRFKAMSLFRFFTYTISTATIIQLTDQQKNHWQMTRQNKYFTFSSFHFSSKDAVSSLSDMKISCSSVFNIIINWICFDWTRRQDLNDSQKLEWMFLLLFCNTEQTKWSTDKLKMNQ